MTILWTFTMGLLAVLGFMIIPFLVGLPAEMYFRDKKYPIDPYRTWYCGFLILFMSAAIYAIGYFVRLFI